MSENPCAKEPLIELKKAYKAFGSNVILDNIDLTIHRGDSLVMIGPSGTGKSTILRIIAGLLPLDGGEIYVKGQLREGLIEDSQELIRISLVFQQAALFDSLNVRENIGFLLYQYSKLSKEKIKKLVEERLEMVGLPDNIGERYPSELSGGMRKRVSLARAIMSDPEDPKSVPELILYDEPTAGLDPIASTVVEDLIGRLQSINGVCSTYVVVSHQHSTIRRTGENLILLYQGKIQWQGAVSELSNTASPIMHQFLTGNTDGPIQVAD